MQLLTVVGVGQVTTDDDGGYGFRLISHERMYLLTKLLSDRFFIDPRSFTL